MVLLFPDPVTNAFLLSTGGDAVGWMPYTHQASWQLKEFENSYYSLPPVAVISILTLGGINENISCFHFTIFSTLSHLKVYNKLSYKQHTEIVLATSAV